MPVKILAVDDNEDGLFALERVLLEAGYEVVCASSGEEAFQKASENEDLALILLDVVMPRGNGYVITQRLKSDPKLRYIPVYLLSGKDELADIVKGLNFGADGYITKPYQTAELLARVRAALRLKQLYQELQRSEETKQYLLGELSSNYDSAQVIGQSAAMKRIFELLGKLADVDSPVLINGPTGAGKELVARAIHANSRRRTELFLAQNCAALSDSLAESELFGFIKGSFTGALRDKKGLFEAADRGTLFLDEVGELSASMQAKLLRVLQEGVFLPVGSTIERKVDVRIIAATNRDLLEMVEAGKFREDLYYRLNVFGLLVPSLAERREDIPALVSHFVDKLSRRIGGKARAVSAQALEYLSNYNWRGNVRELQNEIERMYILGRDRPVLDLDSMSERILQYYSQDTGPGNSLHSSAASPVSLKVALESLEKLLIGQALSAASGNKSEAAKALGMSRSSLISKVKEYQLESEPSN